MEGCLDGDLPVVARAEDAERKLAGVAEEIATTKTAALVEYQSSAEFQQVQGESFDDGVCTFIYNVWWEHLEWDLYFLGEAAREMVAEFNAPPETSLAEPSTKFVPLANQSLEVVDGSPQVINEDSVVATNGSDGGADKDDKVWRLITLLAS